MMRCVKSDRGYLRLGGSKQRVFMNGIGYIRKYGVLTVDIVEGAIESMGQLY